MGFRVPHLGDSFIVAKVGIRTCANRLLNSPLSRLERSAVEGPLHFAFVYPVLVLFLSVLLSVLIRVKFFPPYSSANPHVNGLDPPKYT